MFWFTEIKITTQKGVNPKCTSHQKLLANVLTSSSTETTCMTNLSILM